MKNCLFVLLIILAARPLQAQSSLCLTGGANIGRHGFAELGLAKRTIGEERHYSVGVTTYTVELKPDRRFIIGPKLGIWGFAMSNLGFGLNLIYYTDFDKGSLVFRPEAGAAFEFGKLIYGYNSSIVNKNFPGVNKHQVAVMFLLKLKDVKEKPKK